MAQTPTEIDHVNSQQPQTHTDLYQSFSPTQADFRNENLSRLVLSYIKGERMVDVGCGNGLLLSMAIAQGLSAEGIEPDLKLVQLAKNQYPNLVIHHCDAESFSTQHLFDTVVSVDILECMPDYIPTLSAIVKLVKPGGRLIVVVPAIPWLFGSRDQMMGYHRRFSRRELTQALTAAGLSVLHTRFWNTALVLPYLFLYKLLKRQSHYQQFRSNPSASIIVRLSAYLLYGWFKHVENRMNFGVGLTLLAVAQRPKALIQ